MYIKDLLCISAQPTYEEGEFEKGVICHEGGIFKAIEPSYAELIPAGVLRRMSKIARMGVGVGMPLLKKHTDVEGIIVGTAHGGVDDSMKFLSQIEQYEEGTLTPTNFVQSTPNSLAGVLSVMSGCDGYNNTHVHEGLSFENALLDAMLYCEEKDASLLLGAADEISDWNYNIEKQKGFYKNEHTNSATLLESKTYGSVCGEGAVMFVVGSRPENSLACVKGVHHLVSEDIEEVKTHLFQFLEKYKISENAIEMLICGNNGDIRTDGLYSQLTEGKFSNSGTIAYKHLFGEFPTVSAMAMWLGVKMLCKTSLPEIINIKPAQREVNNILIINHYMGQQFGFVLLTK